MLLESQETGNPLDSTCPNCGARGNFVSHGHYFRHLVTVGGCERLKVRRVRCLSCDATHAVLPKDVVPYRAYAESFVLSVLAAWASGISNSKVREKFGIAESTRRRIVARSRTRICALLSCPAARDAVSAAVADAGTTGIPSMHIRLFGTRFAQNVRLGNSRARPRAPLRPST